MTCCLMLKPRFSRRERAESFRAFIRGAEVGLKVGKNMNPAWLILRSRRMGYGLKLTSSQPVY